jgi:hypothetical protein
MKIGLFVKKQTKNPRKCKSFLTHLILESIFPQIKGERAREKERERRRESLTHPLF